MKNKIFNFDVNDDDRIAKIVPKDKIYFLPVKLKEIIIQFFDSGKIDDEGCFTSKLSELEFRFYLHRFKNQIAVMKLPETPEGPNENNLQTVLDFSNSPHTVVSIPRKAGLNSLILNQRQEMEKCKADFNYFASKYLKMKIKSFEDLKLNWLPKPETEKSLVYEPKKDENQIEKHS